ncbi:hypothetical protein DYB35_012624 [Aphanomyces astaci]|uniref:EGF-like domain-containing protein n=1 Tax=Aphanomyces astaci TaxID=112090 RepID=A0A397BNW9_APHAT|nr:hypothetical protein DYB36_011930 [Aphanomyces astaci]RHY93073.1 hypothetical protein DYB35_012624 [Aphanomyces astaci]RHZ39421.1 hypothetical protein DYB26_002743 [Aphanomyces astaci]
MQIRSIVSVAAAAIVSVVVAQTTDETTAPAVISSRPGICKGTGASADCAKYGQGYSCVAVESKVIGATLLSQCVRGNACGGNLNGRCPTFTNWPASIRRVQPVCAFSEVPNCDNAMNADGTSSVAVNDKTVSCFGATFVSATNSSHTKKVNGIYKCVDQKLYREKNMGFLDLTEKQLRACAGNVTTNNNGVRVSLGLCNAHGTCAPKSSLSGEYGCICNAGYSANDNCFVAVGNVCDAFGQCGSNGACDPKSGKCVCKPGSTGNQCSKCDPTAPAESVCTNRGSCDVGGTCQCNVGFEGLQCETRSRPVLDDSTTEDSDTSAANLAVSTAAVVTVAIAMAFAF